MGCVPSVTLSLSLLWRGEGRYFAFLPSRSYHNYIGRLYGGPLRFGQLCARTSSVCLLSRTPLPPDSYMEITRLMKSLGTLYLIVERSILSGGIQTDVFVLYNFVRRPHFFSGVVLII